MASDPLLSNGADEPRNDADVAAMERARSLLAAYVGRNRDGDTRRLADAVARLDGELRRRQARQTAAALLDGLADAAALIGRIRSVLAADEALPTDVQFAAERVDDIALALRRRGVDAALCDWLAATAREIGDAIVTHRASSARAAHASSLLEDLARRVRDITALIHAAGLVADAAADPPPPSGRVGSLNDIAAGGADDAAGRAPGAPGGLKPSSLPEMEAQAADGGNADAAFAESLAALRALSEEELIALFG